MVIDLSETYRHILPELFPNARVVVDRLHVVRLVNHHLLKLWEQQDPEGRMNRGLLGLMRRHHWKLEPKQQLVLHAYQTQWPVLQALYQAKQRLMALLLVKTVNVQKARQLLPKLLALLEQFAQSPAKTLAATLKSWIEPIVGMWRFSRANGITEGFYTKMEMLSRGACRFRNFENYRIRVLAHCSWNGIINSVK